MNDRIEPTKKTSIDDLLRQIENNLELLKQGNTTCAPVEAPIPEAVPEPARPTPEDKTRLQENMQKFRALKTMIGTLGVISRK